MKYANQHCPQPQNCNEISLAGEDKQTIIEALKRIGVEDSQLMMRASQIWKWIYVRGARSINEMTDVSKVLRAQLEKQFTLDRPEIISEQASKDGTQKWLLRLKQLETDRYAPEIECVYIPETDRGTLCISSQVGCTLNCSFCHTGTQRFVRNLTTQEIVAQILVARDRIGDWPNIKLDAVGHLFPKTRRKITNLVFMGMGEPLYNFENVKRSVLIASDNEGISLSK
ncbi:MAG: 23S rRNA (adenine(2503)-C(2))-methyltransferase RlmN, partial [Hyphomicrobiaceae bacterium]|nr:23S rRNA (adenine(2503)-C(2))-methyltransferase RlmN [Hyphomicrobiaceae bacterium]